ncbi:5-methyltetrahydropteroyltriglutamate--homocysteine S-methyltransferase [Halobacillus karajensis]|uniref:5-methyltetrahydropteroyltriglutamate--homocysteine methyltransferase n=1 Tax=Halobacillus karajensis TaxID=195088 RepID=A0A024P4Y7_9BACI|nr:5-methyltetrahydropteroyltriglutamate--homocysteine S-methyltransferase [Halobacillus karajensis]CDQ20581.1 5-methyltetrahydropteroyltriglutamate--homocysteine methyltransferase [Halobacillus karajensis]CDQ23950.1 5-methyltetrahydropteroyltriglutamate--homocysteine methyltransferase [Halobacillus karajensis]CDQ27428.1 5-methyltetrahydropteroyltriglutamate--homocysteine methyltransferase [Halobacillus karajensis]
MTHVQSSALGYPRIGEKREWKKSLERFWKGNQTEEVLRTELKELRLKNLQKQKDLGLDWIPVGDFSYYDHVLDTAVMFGLIPERFKQKDQSLLQTYFDIARGNETAVASEMTKWFNTNYHYIVPEIDTEPKLLENRPLYYFNEAKDELGIIGKPVLLGPITFLKLAKGYEDYDAFLDHLVPLYIDVLKELAEAGAEWVQIDEPILCTTLEDKELAYFEKVYKKITREVPDLKLLLQTYFESIDYYEQVISLPVEGIGIDFIYDEGNHINALEKHGFPEGKTLAAGIIDGRNVWKNDLNHSLETIDTLRKHIKDEQLILQPSCSLLHVPVTTETEEKLAPELKNALAFADQKIEEVALLKKGVNEGREAIASAIDKQQSTWKQFKQVTGRTNPIVQEELSAWSGKQPSRALPFAERQKLQEETFQLPLLPTTTIGSLPQTTDIRKARASFRKGEWTPEKYEAFIEERTAAWIHHQEALGLDVLVHGEFERNDMVEYFGEKLDGFTFTQFAWVQSYGSRCVKPPIIYGDVAWKAPMTIKESAFAQSLTNKPVKGMLTGPVTILNWSFVRNDIEPAEVTTQIALALKKELSALEENGIRMLQVDEPALREGLPLKKEKQQSYLDDAVYAFKLATSGVKNDTQVHTHMCYSEFGEIIDTIDQLDADVISIEAARSHGELIADFETFGYDKEIGLGVYDIHSPRIPSILEMEQSITRALKVLKARQFWVNPDCGLKTRTKEEVLPALNHMVEAAKNVRAKQTTVSKR